VDPIPNECRKQKLACIAERVQGTKIETFHVRCYVCNNPKEVSNGSPWRSLFD
jgi:hypothetical protein